VKYLTAKVTVANNTRIAPDIGEALEKYCKDTNRSKNDVTEEALKQYLTEKGFYIGKQNSAK
jgi:hypothetical protein